MKPSVDSGEGRVETARPSSRFISALLVLVALLAAPSAAQAAPTVPILTGTDPGSPGIDLAPFVQGSSTGVIISAIPPMRSAPIVSAPGDEDPTILLYDNKSCEGLPAAEGSNHALDTVGIQIPVEAETTTFISAQQRDSTGTSGCSNTVVYQHVKELPPPGGPPPGPPAGAGDSKPPDPPRLRTIPGGIANDNTPLVTGSAPGAASVKIFTNPTCEGAPVASGSVAQFSAGLRVEVVNNALIAFYGVSVGPGGSRSRCSAGVYYVEDSTAPHTRITMGPASKTRRRVAVFRFTDVNGDMPGTRFFCRVDKKRWKQCSSPLHLRRLRHRRYTVRVKATDPAGNVETKPATRRFKVISPR